MTSAVNTVRLLAALCVLLAGCEGANRPLISSPVILGHDPVVLVPDPPLSTRSHFNLLCVAIPPDYRIDSLTLRSGSGAEVRVTASLIDAAGVSHSFRSQSFLLSQQRYVCLSSDGREAPDARYKQLSIWSSVPFPSDDIRWLSTDKR